MNFTETSHCGPVPEKMVYVADLGFTAEWQAARYFVSSKRFGFYMAIWKTV
jgi:hypothetical protein